MRQNTFSSHLSFLLKKGIREKYQLAAQLESAKAGQTSGDQN